MTYWTDASALYEVQFRAGKDSTPRHNSAFWYLKSRLDGETEEIANEIANSGEEDEES